MLIPELTVPEKKACDSAEGLGKWEKYREMRTIRNFWGYYI